MKRVYTTPSGCKVIRVKDVKIPLPAVFGHHEALTGDELSNLIADLQAELRNGYGR